MCGGGAAQRSGPGPHVTHGALGAGSAAQPGRAACHRAAAWPAGLWRGGEETTRLLYQRRPAACHQGCRCGNCGETRPGSDPEHGELLRQTQQTRGSIVRTVPVQVTTVPVGLSNYYNILHIHYDDF